MKDLRSFVAAKLLPSLRGHWPEPRCEIDHKNALQLMVGVILSAQSTDKVVNEITLALFKRFPTAQAFAEADPLELEKAIYRTGFYRAKTKSLMNACRVIVEKFGGQVPKRMEELVQIPGIGRKSANVILGAAYGISSGIVVDTHMIRLAHRLGLSRSEDPVRIEQDLCAVVPEPEWIYFSQAMVLHGRYICQAKIPRCWECHLFKICPFGEKVLAPKPSEKPAPRATLAGIPILTRTNPT
jgi:endonuclease-3